MTPDLGIMPKGPRTKVRTFVPLGPRKRRRRGVTPKTCCFLLHPPPAHPKQNARTRMERPLIRKTLYKTGTSNLPWTTTVNIVTTLFNAKSFALFTNIRVGQVPHYKNLIAVLTKVVVNIISLLVFGTNTTPRKEVNLKRDDTHVSTLSVILTTVESFVVRLLRLLARPVLPDMVAIMKTITRMKIS